MLIKVSVENFLSFDQRTELDMIASNRIQKNMEHTVDVNGLPLLKFASIYGANAAGKSNFIEIFRFIRYCIMRTIPIWATGMFCKKTKENEKRESVFEIQFTLNDKFYAYGFSAILKERIITSEWFHELLITGTSQEIFRRGNGEKPVIGEKLKISTADQKKMNTYLDDFDEKSNSLFLNFMNIGKKYSKDSSLLIFRDFYSWISSKVNIYRPHSMRTDFTTYYEETSLSKINELIQSFDTGIKEVFISEISLDDFKKELPEPIYKDIMEKLSKQVEQNDGEGINATMRWEDGFFNIEVKEDGNFKITTLALKHYHSFFDFSFREESDGTKRLFELIDTLLTKEENIVIIIDELERSLHPKMTARFIELFNEMHENRKIQLIFTTHETTIMDQKYFRRDEIWFVERNHTNDSVIYSLDKFKERYDKKLSKAYLEGRYGAIPVFSSLEDDKVI